MKILGIALIVLGILGLAYGGLSWTRDKTVLDAGPLELKAEQRESLPIPPIAGAILLVAGVVIAMRR